MPTHSFKPTALPTTGSAEAVRARFLSDLPVSERRLRLAGISTSVLEGGSGPPLVLLHGQGEFAGVWLRVMPELAKTHRVIVPDLPGHGASDSGDEALDVDRVLDWMAELIDATCDVPPALVGHLLGGAIAIRFVIHRRDSVERLVLVDSLGLSWFRPTLRFGLAMVGFMARPTPRSQDRLFRRCMLDLDALRDDMDGQMEQLEAYALDRSRGPYLQSALRSLMPRIGVPPVPDDELRGITVPTSLIWGRHDEQVRLRVAETASERYGWPLHVIDEAADDPAVEAPRAFLDALRA